MTISGVYAGSFDPMTNGHMWLVGEIVRLRLCDRLFIAVGYNPDKKYEFNPTERRELVEESILTLPKNSGVEVVVESFGTKYLVDVARNLGATIVFRGIRSVEDFWAERRMTNFNAQRDSNLGFVPLLPPQSLLDVSSSFVKSLIGFDGWEDEVHRRVPAPVFEALKARHHASGS